MNRMLRAPLLIAACFLIWVSLANAGQSEEEKRRERIQRVRDLRAAAAAVNQKKYDEAITLYTRGIDSGQLPTEESSFLAYTERAEVYRIVGKYDLALADLKQAMEIKPDRAGLYIRRAIVWAGKGEYDRAISDYTHVIEKKSNLSSDVAAAYSYRAGVYLKKDNDDQALKDIEKAMALGFTGSEEFYKRGLIWKRKKEYDRAIADFSKAIKRNRDCWQAYRERGDIWQIKGNKKKAQQDFAQANIIQTVPRQLRHVK